jgi:hypothetical protein
MQGMNMIKGVNPSSLQANIWCATFQPLMQHVNRQKIIYKPL